MAQTPKGRKELVFRSMNAWRNYYLPKEMLEKENTQQEIDSTEWYELLGKKLADKAIDELIENA